MKTELLGQDKNIVRIKVDFEAEEFSKSLKEALDKLSQQANIPGFRKGRAPRKVLEMRFGRKALLNEAMDNLLNENVPQIAEDYELDLLDNPKLEPCEPKEGEPLSCVLAFEVMPEVELPDIEAMEIEKLRITPPDDGVVDRAVRALRKRMAEVRAADRPVGPEDLVTGSVTIRILPESGEGEPEVRGPAKNEIDLFEENIRPAIRDALVGHSKGETVETDFEVEAANPSADLAGRKVHYTVVIEDISEYVLPELNEEFYKKAAGEDTEIKTEEAFRQWVRDRLVETAEGDARNDAEQRALARISREAKLDVPMLLIRRQANALRRADEREARAQGRELKDLLGQEDEDWEKKYTNVLLMRARAMVRQSLVVDAIANKYGVTVDKEEVDAAILARAIAYEVDPEALKNRYYKDESALENLANDVRFGKTTDLLLEKMQVKEVDELSRGPLVLDSSGAEPAGETPSGEASPEGAPEGEGA